MLASDSESRSLAAEIRAARVDVLVVGLGKPRQELWIAEYGYLTGAGALLAFGAVVDFLAERVTRAPSWMSARGLEWSYRLALEPLRLSRRYLVDGPGAYHRLRRAGSPEAQPTSGPAATFVVDGEDADVTVVAVTYESAEVIDDLLTDLRREAGALRLRVVVVDNDSSDETAALARAHPDVVVVVAEANGGYASGINYGVRSAGPCRAVLVLNPDVRIDPGALLPLWSRLWQPGVGAVVPQVLDAADRRTDSLRFEPTALRSLGDAMFGDRLAGRPTWLTETDHDPESYAHAHAIDWATGACVMVRWEVSESVGPWDESFFLYSEEVDFLRRVRGAGWATWFEPAAIMHHQGMGSGTSPELEALLVVNKVRYFAKHHGPARVAALRAAVTLGELVRCGRGNHLTALSYLLLRSRWDRLPGPVQPTTDHPAVTPEGRPSSGSVVVPAHNEETVLSRTIMPLAGLVAAGHVQLVIAANGCTDSTVECASTLPGAVVLDLPDASKAGALNAGDRAADRWPRIYVDADVEITPRAVADTLSALESGPALAARPPLHYDSTGASWPVRSYYRARGRLGEAHAHLWGAGVYALSRAGRERFVDFPDVMADDLFVDTLFGPDETVVVDTDPVIVHTPVDVRSLLKVLHRVYAGNRELSSVPGLGRQPTTARTLRDLIMTGRSPAHVVDALVYVSIVLVARVSYRWAASGWSRDDSSRSLIQQVV